MAQILRTLLPPGGFSNHVGHQVAALDVASALTLPAARCAAAADRAAEACGVLRDIGRIESAWVHQAVAGVPTPPEPEGDPQDVEAWIGWLEAVRTVTVMALRPLADRDLERVVRVPEDAEDEGPRTLRRLLAELLYRQAALRGRLDA